MTDKDPSDPALAIATDDKIGRLYRQPSFTLPESLPTDKIKELVQAGHLVPSTTNVIGVRSSPFLLPWATRLVASAAVNMAKDNSSVFVERVKANSYGAIAYFKDSANRERDFWGNQGTRIHLMCELLAQSKDVSYLSPTDYEQKSIDQFSLWLDTFQPTFKHLEITGFGKTEDNLGYAHTTDFIADIGNVKTIGDYKCVVDETPILLANGSSVNAVDIQLGDEVVAWTQDKGLHVAPISYVGDNGYHKVATINTSSGQRITTTLNHPFWSSRKSQKMAWTTAEDLHVGDELYVALGWNYSPARQEVEWPFRKNLSPYVLGVLWSLRNYSRQDWRTENLIDLPRISRPELREELSEMGFTFTKAGKMNTDNGFAKIARKNKIEVNDVLDLIDTPELPSFLYGADNNHLVAFFSGVREVFVNKAVYPDELYVVYKNDAALKNLQQLYLNYGQPAIFAHDSKARLSYLKVPFDNKDTIFAHGPTATKITSIEITDEEEHTIAIEVQGSHTHVTAGLISHNTNRSGLHIDVAIQLAANKRGTHLAIDNKTLVPAPTLEMGLGVHISPKGVKMVEIDTSDEVYDIFQSLRKVWDFHAFEGKLKTKNGIMLRTINSLKDL